MAVLTNLASTLTARYFPSKTLTDAFYLDGRLFGKREARQADITIEKNERGYFLSVFAHPKLANYEPGMMPPYEPELRGTCNEVKFGHKEIDEMIEGFLTTAVDVTGKSRIAEADDRTPYFSGVIVRDSEAFAVTIGTGLAFLYRDDTLYPLTDAGIPMEPIDAKGNRVADFLYFCSSKTANALWSNFFTLAQDDCIILCNKEVYDALGQREILRILDEADDQCDAAGVIITQASARMPDVPMQFAISFVEDVVSDEKKGLFGFRKKVKEEDTSDMSIQSTLDGGLVGAAANAAAQAGFAGSMTIEDYQPQGTENSFVMFGDNAAGGMTPPAVNQQATGDQGIVVEPPKKAEDNNFVQFLDPSIDKNVSEVSAEDVMKTLFADSVKAVSDTAAAAAGAAGAAAAAGTFVAGAAAASQAAPAAAEAAAAGAAASAAESIFVSEAVNPFASVSSTPSPEMQTVSTTEFTINEDTDADKTKPVERLDAAFMAKLAQESAEAEAKKASAESSATSPFVAASYAPEVKAEPEVAPAPAPVPEQPAEGTFVFSETTETPFVAAAAAADAGSEFNPYSVGNGEEMQNAEPPVFGETGVLTAPSDEELISASEGIPVPEFDIQSDKPQIEESDKLGVEFPVMTDNDKPAEQNNENVQPESDGDFSLPFENGAETVNDIPEPVPEQIPEMPVYGANDYQAPTAAVNADVPADNPDQGVYSYGQMVNNENMAEEPVPEAPAADPGLDFGFAMPQAAAPVQAAPEQIPVQQAPDQSGYESLSPTSYGPYDEQPYVDGKYGYTPGQYQEGYDNPAGTPGEVPPSSDDDWINSILGIDDSAFDMAGAAAGAAVAAEQGMEAGGAAMAGNGAYGVTPQPSNQGVPPVQRRPGGSTSSRPRTQSSGSGNGGGKRKVPRLNRNGYMFLAFVIVCVVCLIILISAIVRSCGKEDAEVSETNVNETATVETMIPVETEPAATTTQDPSYPIGRFQFSDYIGYRTWWDLFNTVYGIDDIANTSDARIQIILDYNGLDASYTPSNGDQLLLPPVGVLDGTIPVTFQVGGGSAPADTSSTVSGEVQTVDGAADPAAAETEAANPDEFVAMAEDPT
ncbi:MAG: hypothetical protein ILA15_02590 [Clostridiales bacterium]|nr:hypothetical protein [Clostridiales bacterium]